MSVPGFVYLPIVALLIDKSYLVFILLLPLLLLPLLQTCEKRMHLYLHVGAGFLVWFVYLPIVALVCSHISALNRFKTILCISYAADFIAFATLVHLFWPCR